MRSDHKTYRFRMQPSKAQERAMRSNAGARRWVWNWALQRWREHYAETGKAIPTSKLSADLTELKRKPETLWLREPIAQALQAAIRDLYFAFSNFFARRARYPRFKRRKQSTGSFRLPQGVRLEHGMVFVPKIGFVRIRQSQAVTEEIDVATFRREADGYWYVSLTTRIELPSPTERRAAPVGIDLGLVDFAVLSDGTHVAAPKFFRREQQRLKKAQRAMTRARCGSKRGRKTRLRLARQHRHVSAGRSDFLHKLSSSVVSKFDVICIEDLQLRSLARTKLAKSFADAAMGKFRRQLEYKSQWQGKRVVVVDRFFPSTKRCSACGYVCAEIALKVRTWQCLACGAWHARDFNAACNIRDEGLRILAAGHADR